MKNMEDCIFCKIIKGEIPSQKVYEDDKILAFRDINPAAPVHILVIPKKHIEKITDLQEEDSSYITHIFLKMKEIAKQEGVAENGFRVISNCGKESGQEVMHLHFHMLAGKQMGPLLTK